MKCINFFCVALNKLIQKIDKRHFASARQQHSGFKSKDRTPGSPSSLLPPDGCPKWAVDTSVSIIWNHCKFHNIIANFHCDKRNFYKFEVTITNPKNTKPNSDTGCKLLLLIEPFNRDKPLVPKNNMRLDLSHELHLALHILLKAVFPGILQVKLVTLIPA